MVVYVITDSNNVVKGISTTPLENSIQIEIDIDINSIEISNSTFTIYNYKIVDNTLVELTEEEKEILFPIQPPVPTLQEQIEELKNIVNNSNENLNDKINNSNENLSSQQELLNFITDVVVQLTMPVI